MPTSASARPRTLTYVGLAAAGFAAALVIPWLLVAAANTLPDRTALVLFDDRVATWLSQNGTATTDLAFRVVSLFGDWLLVAVMFSAIARFVMRRHFAKAATLLVAGAGAALINVVLAMTFSRAHSATATGFESVAQGVNFPSGHSMVALVVYGLLAYFVLRSRRWSAGKQTASTVATVVLVALIGFARIYLGVHSVSDVLLGFAAGITWLAACIFAYRRIGAELDTTPAPQAATLQATTL
jgi:membrane-associated phospholipid phosphatase